jgi:hypothetical protein
MEKFCLDFVRHRPLKRIRRPSRIHEKKTLTEKRRLKVNDSLRQEQGQEEQKVKMSKQDREKVEAKLISQLSDLKNSITSIQQKLETKTSEDWVNYELEATIDVLRTLEMVFASTRRLWEIVDEGGSDALLDDAMREMVNMKGLFNDAEKKRQEIRQKHERRDRMIDDLTVRMQRSALAIRQIHKRMRIENDVVKYKAGLEVETERQLCLGRLLVLQRRFWNELDAGAPREKLDGIRSSIDARRKQCMEGPPPSPHAPVPSAPHVDNHPFERLPNWEWNDCHLDSFLAGVYACLKDMHPKNLCGFLGAWMERKRKEGRTFTPSESAFFDIMCKLDDPKIHPGKVINDARNDLKANITPFFREDDRTEYSDAVVWSDRWYSLFEYSVRVRGKCDLHGWSEKIQHMAFDTSYFDPTKNYSVMEIIEGTFKQPTILRSSTARICGAIGDDDVRCGRILSENTRRWETYPTVFLINALPIVENITNATNPLSFKVGDDFNCHLTDRVKHDLKSRIITKPIQLTAILSNLSLMHWIAYIRHGEEWFAYNDMGHKHMIDKLPPGTIMYGTMALFA